MSEMQKNIARNIEKARIIRKVSLSELAARLGISKNKLKKYESGEEYISSKIIVAVTNSLRITLNFLLFSPQNPNGETLVRMNRMSIPEREKKSILELAKYNAAQIDSFVKFSKILSDKKDKIHVLKSAQEFGDKMGEACLLCENLVDFLQKNGILLARLSADTALFKGLFIKKDTTPIIMIPEKYVSETDITKIIAHELCHALISQDSDFDISEKEEEKYCANFATAFLKKCLKSQNFALGNVDFLRDKVIDFWRNDKITISLAAELLGTTVGNFMEKYEK